MDNGGGRRGGRVPFCQPNCFELEAASSHWVLLQRRPGESGVSASQGRSFSSPKSCSAALDGRWPTMPKSANVWPVVCPLSSVPLPGLPEGPLPSGRCVRDAWGQARFGILRTPRDGAVPATLGFAGEGLPLPCLLRLGEGLLGEGRCLLGSAPARSRGCWVPWLREGGVPRVLPEYVSVPPLRRPT